MRAVKAITRIGATVSVVLAVAAYLYLGSQTQSVQAQQGNFKHITALPNGGWVLRVEDGNAVCYVVDGYAKAYNGGGPVNAISCIPKPSGEGQTMMIRVPKGEGGAR